MIKNIIFDFGAVLLPIDETKTWEAFEALGSAPELKDQKESFHAYEKGEITTDEFLKRIQPHFFRPHIFKGDLSRAWNAMLCHVLPPGRIEFLKKLKKDYRLFLLSNTNELHVKKIKQDNGPFLYKQFIRQFEQVYFSYEMGMRKPDAEIFEKLLSEHELEAAETFYIDDGAKHIQTARQLGIHTWHFKPEQHDIEDLNKKLKDL